MSPQGKRFPGHLRLASALDTAGLIYLLACYNRYPPFTAACLQAKQERAAIFATLQAPQARDTAQKRVRHFAARWNLDRVPAVCEMEYHLLGYALVRTGTVVGGTRLGPFGPGPTPLGMYVAPDLPAIVDDERRWDWRPTSGESLGAFRSRIATDLGVRRGSELPESIQAQLWALPEKARQQGWVLSDEQSRLEQRVRWLFLRLCPQPDRPWGYTRIARRDRSKPHPRTLKHDVLVLAARLRISVPEIPPGRPPKRPAATV